MTQYICVYRDSYGANDSFIDKDPGLAFEGFKGYYDNDLTPEDVYIYELRKPIEIQIKYTYKEVDGT